MAAGDAHASDRPIIIGIGLFATDLPNLEIFLGKMAGRLGASYVIAIEHRDLLDEQQFRSRIAAISGRMVKKATKGMRIEPEEVYYLPAGTTGILANGRFEIKTQTELAGERGIIGTFLASLAEQEQKRAIGIVLGGVAAEGTLGVTAIKEQGGLTFSEPSPEPIELAHQSAQPKSAASTADLSMPVDAMAERVQVQIRTLQAERSMERYAPAYMIVDENHNVLHFSGRIGKFIDPPSGHASLNVFSLIHCDLRIGLRTALHKCETDETAVKIRGLKVRQNGSALVVTLLVEPIETAPGQPRRYMIILQDGQIVGDEETGSRAEERLRDSEALLRSVVEGIPQLVWRAVDGGNWTWCSPQWTSFTNQPEMAALGRGWLEPVHPDDRERVIEAWNNTERPGTLEIEHRLWNVDGGYRAVHLRGRPVTDDAGRIVEWFGTTTDIHDMLLLQDRQRILLHELQHRVRNTLAVVRSIARRTAETSGSVKEYAHELDQRIMAMARTQTLLTHAPDSTIDLKKLISAELEAHEPEGKLHVEIDGPSVSISGKVAENLGLAIHELLSNAVRYGALAIGNGRLKVSWNVTDSSVAGKLTISWQETLPSANLVPPAHRGFGSELIEGVVPYQFGGTAQLKFRPEGLLCTIELPLSDNVRLAQQEYQVAELRERKVRSAD